MTTLLFCLLLLCLLTATAASARGYGIHARGPFVSAQIRQTVRQYAHTLILARWHSEAEWRAFDLIIRPESGWHPCAVFPSRRACGYVGSNSCGLPQANPCPMLWRGRLWETRFAQVIWARDYVDRRYGSPSRALSFRRAHGFY